MGYLLQHVALFSGEFEIGGLAVAPFTGLTSDGDEGDVGAVERLRDPFALQGHLFEGATSEEFLHETETCGLVAVGVALGPAAVFRYQSCTDTMGQGVGEVHLVSGVDVPAARAAGNEVVGRCSEKRHTGLGTEGECAAFVVQQDKTLGSGPAGESGVFLQMGISGGLQTPCAARLEDHLQHTPGTGIQHILPVFSLTERPSELTSLQRVARHHEVVAGGNLTAGVAAEGPVGHHETPVVPATAEHFGQEPARLLSALAVEHVVGRHHRPGVALADGYLEGAQIE